MKWMLCLFVIVLLVSPPFGQAMPAAAAEISGATASQILAELQKMNGELAALKADVAELKTEVAELKTEVAVVKAEVGALRQYVEMRITALEEVTTAEIRAVNRRVAVTEYLLIASVTALVTVLLWMLKNHWDRRADRGKMDAQQAEIAALRAENERMKNAGGLVSSSGGRLESE